MGRKYGAQSHTSWSLISSTLTRRRNCDIDLADRMAVDDFIRKRRQSEQRELTAELAPLLRSRSDLDAQDIEILEQIIAAGIQANPAGTQSEWLTHRRGFKRKPRS